MAGRPLLLTLYSTPALRALFVLLFAAAAAQSLPISLVALFAKDELGASNLTVVIYFAAMAVMGLVVVLTMGRYTDAVVTRCPTIRFCFGWLAVGYLAISSILSSWQLFLVGLLFFPVGGVLMAQLMALARETSITISFSPPVIITTLSRTVFSLGYISGAPLGGLLAVHIGPRHVMQASAGIMITCMAIAIFALHSPPVNTPLLSQVKADTDPRSSPTAVVSASKGAGSHPFRLLVAFCSVCVLLSSGRIMQLGMLPVVMRDEMHASASSIGFALAIPPLIELVLMPLAAIAAVRTGRGAIYLVGVVAIVVYYAIVTFATAPWQIFLNQVMYAVYGSAGIALGIDIAQNLLPARVSTATSMYLSHENAASVIGGISAVIAVSALGPQHAFAIPLVMCTVGFSCILVLFGRNRDSFDFK